MSEILFKVSLCIIIIVVALSLTGLVFGSVVGSDDPYLRVSKVCSSQYGLGSSDYGQCMADLGAQ